MEWMKDFVKGFDVSTLLEVENLGGRFFDSGPSEDALVILKRYGANWVRLRLWNDPYTSEGDSYGAGVCDYPCLVQLARRAKALGMKWLLDLHYSDFWADPGKQIPPKKWQGMNPNQLEQAVEQYTGEVLEQLAQEGLSPDMVQVGNEVTNGLLWPYGKVPEWDNIARFIMAGVRAVRAFDSKLPVMLHLDNGGRNDLYRTWFDNFVQRGGDFDVMGLSYYPFWHGTMEDLAINMNDMALRYGRPLIIAETSMGFTMEDYGVREGLAAGERKGAATRPELAARVPFPMTPQGQADFTKKLLQVIKGVPKGLGLGLYWWEAAWIPVPGSGWANRGGWEYVHEKGPGGNEWANQALFDFDGHVLPALEVIRDA